MKIKVELLEGESGESIKEDIFRLKDSWKRPFGDLI